MLRPRVLQTGLLPASARHASDSDCTSRRKGHATTPYEYLKESASSFGIETLIVLRWVSNGHACWRGGSQGAASCELEPQGSTRTGTRILKSLFDRGSSGRAWPEQTDKNSRQGHHAKSSSRTTTSRDIRPARLGFLCQYPGAEVRCVSGAILTS